jgi:hypothetical protein
MKENEDPDTLGVLFGFPLGFLGFCTAECALRCAKPRIPDLGRV